MKVISIIILILIFNISAIGQVIISGTVTDSKKAPIPGANIYFKGTYDGTSTDKDGKFSLKTNLKGNQILMVSFIGYETSQKAITISGNNEIKVSVELKDAQTNINTVTITAGAFEAGDKKKGTILKPLDIVTTSFGMGDIYGALNTLPGTQKVGEKGELFVRGGEGYETRTFIDGLLVQKPYSSEMPDMASRGRFSPFLFTGTLFSSGGYSAEYGQALSSALILNTEGLAPESLTSISLMSVGAGASKTVRSKNTSLSVSAEYINMQPYYNAVKQDLDWVKMPEAGSGTIVFRTKTSENALLKVFGSYQKSSSKLNYPDFNSYNNTAKLIGLYSDNLFLISTYNCFLTSKLQFYTGISYSSDIDNKDIDINKFEESIKNSQLKIGLKYDLNQKIQISGGGETDYRRFYQNYSDRADNTDYTTSFNDANTAAYLESNIKLGTKIAASIGLRFENASVIKKAAVVPRLSMAYKTGAYSQISMAYGRFVQTPQDQILRVSRQLTFENAEHYILNYQLMKNSRIFRIETFYKKYDDLVKYDKNDLYNPMKYNNGGNGYSKGVDIFYRDQKTFKNTDLWISYSYLDSKRDYKDFEKKATPTFISEHNLSAVYKYWINTLNTQVSASYVFSSGRTYYNPNNKDFLSDKTSANHDLSLSISYLTSIFDNYTIVFFSMNNVLGNKNIYGYNYSSTPDEKGQYREFAVKPPAGRFVFLGVFISIK